MIDSITIFKQQLLSGTPTEQENALAQLAGFGAQSIPSLENALASESPQIRALAMEGLARIADSSSLNLFIGSLKDPQPDVRAWAAQGLTNLQYPGAVQALIETLHDAPDEAHGPYTRSASRLIGMGPKVLPEVFLLLQNDNLYTRELAFRMLSDIITKQPEYQYKWSEIWEMNGRYSPEAAPAIRTGAVDLWKKWFKKQSF